MAERHGRWCCHWYCRGQGREDCRGPQAMKQEEHLVAHELTRRVLGAFYAAYSVLGYGLPESLCANAFAVELQARHIVFQREVPLEVVYRGVPVGLFRADFIVEDAVIVEVKCTRELTEGAEAQLLNYLRVSKYEVGLLLHFGIRSGVQRLVYSNARKTQ